MDAAIAIVTEFDPHMVFVNLGDCDRMGHSDLTGTTVQVGRRLALASVDAQVGRFVDLLKQSGRWDTSMVVVLADHSMDWSRPDRLVSLHPVLEADPLLAGRVQIAQNGGADLLYRTGPAARRDAALARMRELAAATPGVLSVRSPGEPRLGPQAGDLIVYCKAGWRFSDPAFSSNPIPGTHGHPATEPIPFFIAGGHPRIPIGVTSSRQAHTVDVAPTVGSFFGVESPRGGYDGRNRA